MHQILVLTTSADRLDDALLDRLGGVLADLAGQPGAPVPLAPEGRAAEIPFTATPATAIEAAKAARQILTGRAIDANVVAAEGRRKAMLVADMDATIVTGESLDDLAARAGIADQVVPITERAMRGELDFREALLARVALLRGRPWSLVEEVRAALTATPGAATLVATMRAHGAFCALVSGGFDCFVDAVAERLGFDRACGNGLEVEDGLIAGTVREPILGKDAKRSYLLQFAAEHGIGADAVIAVGDGANDIPMLSTAGLGVAFRGKPKVKAAVPVAIDHADLTALLYLQGYRADAFVTRG